MGNVDVVEITTEAELREVYPIMKQLRPIGEETFLEVVETMRDESGYQLFALRDDGAYRGLASIVVETNMYHGKHAWVHELVVDETHRGEGYGSQFLSWIEDWAEERDCSCFELASGLWRDEAHEFYEDNDMEKYCYTFKKDLSAESLY